MQINLSKSFLYIFLAASAELCWEWSVESKDDVDKAMAEEEEKLSRIRRIDYERI